MLNYSTLVKDYADHYHENAGVLARALLQTGTAKSAIDVLAYMASNGTLSANEIAEVFRNSDRVACEQYDVNALAWFALVIGVRADEPDAPLARKILQSLVNEVGIRGIPEQAARVFLQLSLSDAPQTVREYLPQSRVRQYDKEALQIDAENPYLFPDSNLSESNWLSQLTRFARTERDLSIQLLEGDEAPFYRLTSGPRQEIHTGPKITVVTSAYNPDAALLTTTRSLIEQTWQNWEMLIVDDASPSPDAEFYLRAAEGLDPRVRVIRKAVNGGTYLARNTAMIQARGEFITFLDSDDWAHPSRLEAGVKPLLSKPYLAASYSLGSRVNANLRITRTFRLNRGPSANSLMFRIRDVVNEIGFFDTTRKAADNEYLNRIISAYGEESIKRVELVGTLSLDGETLSASDFHAGWRHPARTLYRTSYTHLHAKKLGSGASLYLENQHKSPHFGIGLWQKMGDLNYTRRNNLDVVVAGDWYSMGGPQASMLAEIRACLKAGLTVGVTDLRPIRAGMLRNQQLNQELAELLFAGKIEYVFFEEVRHVDTFILRYPPLLQFPSIKTTNLQVNRLIIVANQAPSEPDGADQRYIPADVDRNAKALFGVRPRWVAQGPIIKDILEEFTDTIDLMDSYVPTIVEDVALEPRFPTSDRVVIGRHSRDDVIKFPSTPEDLFAAYGFPDTYDVVMLGATISVGRALRALSREEAPANWEVLPVREIEVDDFLQQIDVFVYFDNENANESFCRVILEAAAAGKLVVASRKHERTFGDAAIYTTPADAVEVVGEYLREREKFEKQVALTLQRVRERWSPEAFLEAMNLRKGAQDSSTAVPELETGKGEIIVRRTSRFKISDVENGTDYAVASIPIRTAADAESSDSMVVVSNARTPDEAKKEALLLRSQFEGGVRDLDSLRQEGAIAILLHREGKWSISAPDTWDIVANGNDIYLATSTEVDISR